MKQSVNEKTLLLKPLDHSFNETYTLNTFLIKPHCYPVIKIRLSVMGGAVAKWSKALLERENK